MIPAPGEPTNNWWGNTGYTALSASGGAEGNGGPIPEDDQYYHDVPPDLAAKDQRNARGQSGAPMTAPWPLSRWPDVPTRFILCTEDRFFPPAFMRQMVADRLPGVVPDEIAAGHMPMLARPAELAALLDGYAVAVAAPARTG